MRKVFQEDSDFYIQDFDAEVMELLPPTPGFFLWNLWEIDKWYEHQLDITISQLTAILDSFDFENETLYYYLVLNSMNNNLII